ncbi:hypothetical protein D3C78_1451390 [compost metagenome]
MTFRSVIAPSGKVALTGTSAGKRRGWLSTVSISGSAAAIASAMLFPSRMDRVRSIPGKIENGPSLATVAMLIRQSKSSTEEPGGKMAISTVSPPPFFQGIRL